MITAAGVPVYYVLVLLVLYLMMVSMRQDKSQVENLTHNKLSCVGRMVQHGKGLLNEKVNFSSSGFVFILCL